MLRILRKAAASSSKTGGSIPDDVVVDDLSVWELVDPSLSDDDDLYSFNSDKSISDDPADEEEEEEEEQASPDAIDFTSPDDVMSLQSLSVSPPVAFPVAVKRHQPHSDDGDVHHHDEDEEDDDAYADDVDDELVPWKLKDKFGKQRIRKMGKRGGPKPGKSKRLPYYYYHRPGCVYGKHGLGVQHSYN